MSKRKPEGMTGAFFDWLKQEKGCAAESIKGDLEAWRCVGEIEMAHFKFLISPKTGQPLPRRKGINYWAVLPLCRRHHRTGRLSVHNIGERQFLAVHEIDGPRLFGSYLAEWLDHLQTEYHAELTGEVPW
jgi:hypothetical protein